MNIDVERMDAESIVSEVERVRSGLARLVRPGEGTCILPPTEPLAAATARLVERGLWWCLPLAPMVGDTDLALSFGSPGRPSQPTVMEVDRGCGQTVATTLGSLVQTEILTAACRSSQSWERYRAAWSQDRARAVELLALVGGAIEPFDRLVEILNTRAFRECGTSRPDFVDVMIERTEWLAQVDPHPSTRALAEYVATRDWRTSREGPSPEVLERLGPWRNRAWGLRLLFDYGNLRSHPAIEERFAEAAAPFDLDTLDPSPQSLVFASSIYGALGDVSFGLFRAAVDGQPALLALRAAGDSSYTGLAHLAAAAAADVSGRPDAAWNLLQTASYFLTRQGPSALVGVFKAGVSLAERSGFPNAAILRKNWEIYLSARPDTDRSGLTFAGLSPGQGHSWVLCPPSGDCGPTMSSPWRLESRISARADDRLTS
jgi:hypothetical protein